MKLSVLVITYNHAPFIAQALNSILMQQTDFDYEIVVGEDCSTDGTRDIVIAYRSKHPGKIRLLLPEKNLGANRNFVATYHACRGDYIAMLEGDDFWTDPQKLQHQVRFLEAHPQFVMCFTDCSVVDENGGVMDQVRVPEGMKRTISQRDISHGTPPTLTVMLRNNLITRFPKDIYRVVNVDMFLSCMLTEFGDAGYIDRNTACYRKHSGGIWSLRSGEFKYRNNLKIRQKLLKLCAGKNQDVLVPEVSAYYVHLLNFYREQKMMAKFSVFFVLYAAFKIKHKILQVVSTEFAHAKR